MILTKNDDFLRVFLKKKKKTIYKRAGKMNT